MSEFDLINRLQEIICIPPGHAIAECIVGIGDDGAVLDVPAGRDLVVCTDTLVAGVHFPAATAPAAIGHKALAVNLSDLAAMGAEPAWFFMALTLPTEDRGWLDAFAAGMAELAADAGIVLAGGDVTSGPLSITVTALGLVGKGGALVRSGAAAGDLVVVSGTPGAAAHALAVLKEGETPAAADLSALDYPVPRLVLGRALRGFATACIDVSDGLAADLGHVLEQSGVGAEVDLDKLPSPASLSTVPAEDRWTLQLAGGDDYELCFTVPAGSANRLDKISEECEIELTVIGLITQKPGLVFRTAEGEVYDPVISGYRHFDGPGIEHL
ncbi:thiamine-phosphate kinase [Pseudomonadota bacterium]